MEYLCLRDCYRGGKFYYGGSTYDLPDDMNKLEKDFQDAVPEPLEKPREPNLGEYRCNKCLSIHRISSKLGKRHLKHREE